MKVIDACTGLANTQLTELAIDPVGYDGVKCRVINNENHPYEARCSIWVGAICSISSVDQLGQKPCSCLSRAFGIVA